MRDLKEYAAFCMELLDELNIQYGNIIEWKINSRAKSRWGQCKYTPSGYIIEISSVLLDERNSSVGLENTILHELLHSCDDTTGHGAQWKKYAEMVNRAYGYNIKRTSSAEEKGVIYRPEVVRKEVKIKYQMKCLKCGVILNRSRNTDFVKFPGLYTHTKCGGSFHRIK